jgi:serralysin
LLFGVALHELTHALGRVPFGPQPDIFDLFRFTAPGVRLFQGSATAPAAYFSVDGGFTKLADYGQTSDSSDFLNSGVQGPNDPFDEFYSGGTNQGVTTVDLLQLDALGFHLTSNTPITIEASGSTSLMVAGNHAYYLVPVGGASGPQLRFAGAPVIAGQFGPSWAAIGAEHNASGGYQVVWAMPSTNQYTVWTTDSSGNYLSQTPVVSAASWYV